MRMWISGIAELTMLLRTKSMSLHDPSERDGRLCPMPGQGIEPLTPATGKDIARPFEMLSEP